MSRIKQKKNCFHQPFVRALNGEWYCGGYICVLTRANTQNFPHKKQQPELQRRDGLTWSDPEKNGAPLLRKNPTATKGFLLLSSSLPSQYL